MRVLLVNTNRIRPPIGPLALDYIGAALHAHGHDIELLDLCWEQDAAHVVERTFAAQSFDLVAVTFRNTDDCYFASKATFLPRLMEDVQLLRRHYDGPMVFGGGGFSVMPGNILSHLGETLGVRGEGELALPLLLESLQGPRYLSEVPGLVYCEDNGWHENARAFADLGELPLAARDIIDNRRYFAEGGQAGIETKRGCPGTCIFCADPVIKGHEPRLRPPTQVVEEIRSLLALGIDHFHLCDSEFNLPSRHAEDVCAAIIEAGLGNQIRWHTYAAPRPLSAELVRLMQKAGCAGINFGVDSAADTMLKRLARTHTRADIEDAAAYCRAADLPFMFDLLLGAPGETRESVAETIQLAKSVSPTCVGLSIGVRVYPGTPLARQLQEVSKPVAGLTGNPDGLEPAFYVSPDLGPDPLEELRALIADDPRFFLPAGDDERDYNYNDNTVLETAIREGKRGAYWAILSALRDG